jgi:hypothetical protein
LKSTGVVIGIGLWETVRMAKEPRYLQFSTLILGQPVTARCSHCDRLFLEKPKHDRERTDEMLLRLRAEFDQHNCNEDASQAAARIVREATE